MKSLCVALVLCIVVLGFGVINLSERIGYLETRNNELIWGELHRLNGQGYMTPVNTASVSGLRPEVDLLQTQVAELMKHKEQK